MAGGLPRAAPFLHCLPGVHRGYVGWKTDSLTVEAYNQNMHLCHYKGLNPKA